MKKNEKGFTLIELLVVVAIIGILAAIAIPQFAAYRQRAFNARAQSDVRNTMTAQEAYFVDNETYAATWAALNSGGVGATKSQGVSLNSVGTTTSFTVNGCHSAGTEKYGYDSSSATTGITKAAAAACAGVTQN